MKFRKRPVVIEAQQLTVFNMEDLERWCGGSIKGMKLAAKDRVIDIQTLEGEMTANVGDWIIKGVKGEFYPCKPDVFEMTYVPADDATDDKIAAFDSAIRALVEDDQQAAVNMLCGHLVGFLSALVQLDGGDPSEEIHIDGGLASRSITIHEKKMVFAQ